MQVIRANERAAKINKDQGCDSLKVQVKVLVLQCTKRSILNHKQGCLAQGGLCGNTVLMAVANGTS